MDGDHGKPLAATAGAMMFERGGNAVDAACAMIAATATMWDVLSWGGETQALIYDPRSRKVIAISGLGVAPTGATPEFYRSKGLKYPPEHGALSAITPGTPGGIMLMLGEYGRLSLSEVLAPAIELADGYPIDAETANNIERWKGTLREWPYSKSVMLPHQGEAREAPQPGEIFRQPTSPRPCASWSKPNGRRSRPASRAGKRSRPRTSASIAATSRPSSSGA
jgi:gamma-glutamyltranspeptidase/glutathione hydrolase